MADIKGTSPSVPAWLQKRREMAKGAPVRTAVMVGLLCVRCGKRAATYAIPSEVGDRTKPLIDRLLFAARFPAALDLRCDNVEGAGDNRFTIACPSCRHRHTLRGQTIHQLVARAALAGSKTARLP